MLTLTMTCQTLGNNPLRKVVFDETKREIFLKRLYLPPKRRGILGQCRANAGPMLYRRFSNIKPLSIVETGPMPGRCWPNAVPGRFIIRQTYMGGGGILYCFQHNRAGTGPMLAYMTITFILSGT